MPNTDQPQGPSQSLINDIADWLMDEALRGATAENLLTECSLRLNAAGISLWRTNLSFQILHPLYAAVSLVWYRESGLEPPTEFVEGVNTDLEQWRQSPLYHIISNNLPFMRRRLTGPDALIDFPILEELRAGGATDYLIYLQRFGGIKQIETRDDGVVGSWVSDRPNGFTDDDIQALRRIQRRLAVACKMAIREQLTQNVLAAYLGADAGHQVLNGQIKLGDGQTIHAVIWFSDLRSSTRLADRLPPEEFIKTVNAYFECTAGAVLTQGGEVLRFIGDAVLAIFPIRSGGMSEEEACAKALAATADAQVRLSALNELREADGQEALAFGIGLHLGDLMYGNIGVSERVEFSVIGPAANEVARLEDLTKTLKRPVLVSDRFAQAYDTDWESLGAHALRGVGDPMEVYAPPANANDQKAAE